MPSPATSPAPAPGPAPPTPSTCADYLAVITDLLGNLDAPARERDAILTLSALVGAIAMARAVDDADLSHQILVDTAGALAAIRAEGARRSTIRAAITRAAERRLE